MPLVNLVAIEDDSSQNACYSLCTQSGVGCDARCLPPALPRVRTLPDRTRVCASPAVRIDKLQTEQYTFPNVGEILYQSALKMDTTKKVAERFPCPQCAQTFTQKCHIKVHVMRVHEKIRYPCERCNMDYADRRSLRMCVERTKRCVLQCIKPSI